MAPFLPAAARRSWSRPRTRGIALAGVVLAIGIVLMVTGKSLFSGNYLTQQGMSSTATLPGFRPLLFPAPLWALLELLSLGAGVALGFLVGTRLRLPRIDTVVGGRRRQRTDHHQPLIWLNGAGLVLYGLFVQGPIFDRYVWSLAFAAAILLAAKVLGTPAVAPALDDAAPQPRPDDQPRPDQQTRPPSALRSPAIATMAATVVLAIVVGAVAASLTLNADAYDGARWSAGQAAVHAGARPSTVDAGFDWVGSHAATPAVRAQGDRPPLLRDVVRPALPEVQGLRLRVRLAPCPARDFSRKTGALPRLGLAFPEYLYVYAVHSRSCR